jgi:ribosome-associated heat shock protein Hsp15
MEAARVDQWLWAIRQFKTRSAATDACRAGHVRVNGSSAKPAATVRPGDRVAVRVHGFDRDLEVVTPIIKRVGAQVAADCYVDHSPPPPPRAERVSPLFERPGRPTKRDRRQLDRFRKG